VISRDGVIWDLPAGRPEPGESWEQTLRREMDEEACATVIAARLLGFTRGQAGLPEFVGIFRVPGTGMSW
jgi:ADP-ribose pyrophosphatase YjhB (NUDIX family)